MRSILLIALLLAAPSGHAQEISAESLARAAAALQDRITRLHSERYQQLLRAQDYYQSGNGAGERLAKSEADRLAREIARLRADAEFIRTTLRAMR